MTKSSGSRSRNAKNSVTNVRVVDDTNGSDSMVTNRFLTEFSKQEGQIRVVCSYRQEIGFATTAQSIAIGFDGLTSTDDFVSFAAQYQEFRVRAIRFEVIDLFGTAGAGNFWGTFHQVGGTPPSNIEDVVDRPDSRSVSAGDGRAQLYWVAHGIPEMSFQNVGAFDNLGGLVVYLGSTSAPQPGRYSIVAKYVVDYRGKR